jgi:hypothetical protein
MDAPVARRNDPPTGVDVYSQSRAFEISGRDPNAVYEWASVDADHPQSAWLKLQRQEIGGGSAIGPDGKPCYAMVEPWTVVPAGEVVQGKQRADGPRTPFDTAVRNGRMVLLKTSKENAAKYEAINAMKADGYSRQLTDGVRGGSSGVTTKIRGHIGTAESGAERASVNDVLNGV